MYLIKNDYKKQIQDVNLQQVISEDDTILHAAQLAAEAECKSYLVQRYETDREFTDTNAWSYTADYNAADRVYLDATAYSATSTYALNDLVSYNGKVYRCTTAILTGEAFNAAKWSEVGTRYAIYYAKYPKPYFDLYKAYAVGDQVFYNNRTYTALKASVVLSHDVALQYRSKENLPLQNVFPDDPVNGSKYWSAGSAYSVAAGTLPSNTTYWTNADNRNQQLVMYAIDITLFHVHTRLTPRNVPQIRVDRYTNAITWLTAAGRGDITASLPVKQPKQGGRIRYGGNLKNINSY